MSGRGTARAILAAAAVAGGSAGAVLPERALPAAHPCRLEDALAPAVARAPRATIVFWEDASGRLAPPLAGRVRVAPVSGCFAVSPGPVEGSASFAYTENDVFGESLPAWLRAAGRDKGPVRLVDGLRARLGEN